MINLEKNINWYENIVEPSWYSVTPKILKVWSSYLHSNRWWYRTIKSYYWWSVIYTDFAWQWECSAQHFCRICPNIATEDEIIFLDKQR